MHFYVYGIHFMNADILNNYENYDCIEETYSFISSLIMKPDLDISTF